MKAGRQINSQPGPSSEIALAALLLDDNTRRYLLYIPFEACQSRSRVVTFADTLATKRIHSAFTACTEEASNRPTARQQEMFPSVCAVIGSLWTMDAVQLSRTGSVLRQHSEPHTRLENTHSDPKYVGDISTYSDTLWPTKLTPSLMCPVKNRMEKLPREDNKGLRSTKLGVRFH